MVPTARRTQADRRARSRRALLEAAAQALSRHGYANLSLEEVARQAGYTRGALYHQFANKEDLALAVVDWVNETWQAEVGRHVEDLADPVEALLTLARRHAVYCRRDIARVMVILRVEFAGRAHPVGRAIAETIDRLVADCSRLISAGRRSGTIPSGPPVSALAPAYLATVESVVIALAGRAPYDAELAERAVRGVLGLPPQEAPTEEGPEV